MSQILNGRYRIDGKQGDGGMAVVYRGWDTVLNRPVAVKVLREQYAMNTQFLRRFQREAQSAAGLAHPNIVNVYDVGRDGETWYIVMELIEGTDLAALIHQHAPYSVTAVTDIMAQVMSALDYAHEHGIVHRDVKPHNILIDSRGTAKVVDFGIAKGINDITMTDAGTALGTAGYISPEQATGAPITASSDIYSAGVVLYEMLTGRLPFMGDTAVSVAMQHVRNAPPPPTRYNPKIPRAIELVILRAMEKLPERRYASGAELVAALRSAVANPMPPSAPQPVTPLGSGGGGVATAVLTPQTRALPLETTPPRMASSSTARPVARPATPPVPRQSSGPGAWVWILGVLLLGGLLAAAYFGYQLINVTSANRDILATRTVVANAFNAAATQTASRPTPTVAQPTMMPTPSNLGEVSNFVGLSQPQAVMEITNRGWEVGKDTRQYDAALPGTVIGQDPTPGQMVKKGSPINLTVSLGPRETDLTKLEKDGKPYDVKGKTPEEVSLLLRNYGLQPLQTSNEPSADVEAGKVTRVASTQGMGAMSSVVANGTPINVYVSAGKPTATPVPATATVLAATVPPTPVPTTVAPTATAPPKPTVPPTAVMMPTPEPTRPMPVNNLILPHVFGFAPELALQTLRNAGFTNASVKTGEGSAGAGATPKGTIYAIIDGRTGMTLTEGQAIPANTMISLVYVEK